MPEPVRKKSSYMPTLDGWRAIAILAVIFHHDAIHALGAVNTRWVWEYGNTGVDVFFAISGILICSRLLDEEKIFGRIHLKSFYIRRAFRILPPALVYLGVIAILAAIGLIVESPGGLLSAVFFCRNYPHLLGSALGDPGYFTTHFWSLSLEEQFYFFLPALLVFTPRQIRIPVLGVLAAVVFLNRIFVLHTHRWEFTQAHTDVRIDSLLVPAIFAVLVSNPRWKPYFQRALRFWPVFVLAILYILPFGIDTAWRASAIVWIMPCIVMGSVLNSQNIFGSILEFAPLKYIGRISYSLYLWQQLFFVEHFDPTGHTLGWVQSWPMRLALTFACAIASYHLLEKPVTRIGHKLAPSATPGRDEPHTPSKTSSPAA